MIPDILCPACGKFTRGDRARCRFCAARMRNPAAPQPSGLLRILIRVAVVVALLVVGLVAAVVFAYFHTDWQPYDSPERGYRVELPAPADPEFGQRGTPLKEPPPGISAPRLEGTRLPLRRRDFGVATATILPPERRVADEAIAREYTARMRDRSGAWTVVSDQPVNVNGFYAREVVIESETRGVAVYRIVVAETRLFIPYATGPTGGAADADFRRFLDSFEVTDRDLLAARAQREQRRLAAEAEAARAAAQQAAETAQRDAEIARIRAEQEKMRADEEEARLARDAAAVARAEAFRTAPTKRGPVPPPTVLGRPVLYYPFDHLAPELLVPNAPGVNPFLTRIDLPRGTVASGPGVTGSALYLPAIAPDVAEAGPWVYAEWMPRSVTDFRELTVAGWVRVRGASVEVVSLNYRTVARPLLALGLSGDRVWARIGTPAGAAMAGADDVPGRVSAAWTADEAWHHLAMTVEQAGERRRVRLYFDGREVAVGEFDFAPAGPQTRGTTGLRVGRATVISGAGGHPPDPERMKLPVVGLDEVCVFDAALNAAEVRRLAGVADPAAAP